MGKDLLNKRLYQRNWKKRKLTFLMMWLEQKEYDYRRKPLQGMWKEERPLLKGMSVYQIKLTVRLMSLGMRRAGDASKMHQQLFCCLFCWRDPLKSGLSSYSVFRHLPLQCHPTPSSGLLDILSLFMCFLIRHLCQVFHKHFVSGQRGTQEPGRELRRGEQQRRGCRKPRHGFHTRKYCVVLRTGKRERKFSK